MRVPDFVIIGAMKCATSTLHEQLARQHGVFMSSPKEPNFFSDDDQWSRGVAWYSSLFEHAAEPSRCGESSTHYTKLPTYPNTVRRAKSLLPESTQFIYVMRHPLDRLVSHYIHDWSEGTISCTLDDAVRTRPELVEYGRYAMQLKPWIEAFGTSRILPVFFERMTIQPQHVLDHIARFLNVPGPVCWSHEAAKENPSGKRLRVSRWRDAILDLPGLVTLRRALVPRRIRDALKAPWLMNERPELPPETAKRLTEVFDSDLAVLGRWFGISLTCATFKDVARTVDPAWSASREVQHA